MGYLVSSRFYARNVGIVSLALRSFVVFTAIFSVLSSFALFQPSAQAQEEERSYPLHEAVRSGDVTEVNRLLSSLGPDSLLQPDDYGMLPLHYSSSTANLEITRIILERYKVDPNAMPPNEYGWILRGRTPLHLAVSSGKVALVDLLLSKGANVLSGDKNGVLPLHLAIQYGNIRIAKNLMSHMGRKVHTKDKNRTTPLHLAAQYGRGILASDLLDLGASVNASNAHGFTALHYGSVGGHENVVELLMSKDAKLDAVTKIGTTPLFLAARDGREGVVELLVSSDGVAIDSQDANSMTPLLVAAANGHGEVVNLLLKGGADIKAKNKQGMLVLHHAAKVEDVDFLGSILKIAGSDINKRDSLGNTALHYATEFGLENNVEILLANGADRSLENLDKKTAQDIATTLGLNQVLSLLR